MRAGNIGPEEEETIEVVPDPAEWPEEVPEQEPMRKPETVPA